jgi:signal transduction histidine kinase
MHRSWNLFIRTFRTAVNQKKEIHLSCCFYKPGLEVCYADVRGHLLQKGDGKPSIIGIMMDTTEKKLLEAETEQLRVNRQKEINAAILVAEERERQHISEALHDGIGQLIYAVKLQVSQFKDATSTKQKSEINALLDEAIRETRNISFQLSPSILVDFGLRVALEELINRLSTAAFHIQLKMSGINGRLGVSNELLIFRIVQELINNCMKHSGANKVEIFLKGNKRTVIEVLDNGRGYLKKEPEKKAMGAGLSSIRNRISVYNGKLTINNRSEGGTAVRVELDI